MGAEVSTGHTVSREQCYKACELSPCFRGKGLILRQVRLWQRDRLARKGPAAPLHHACLAERTGLAPCLPACFPSGRLLLARWGAHHVLCLICVPRLSRPQRPPERMQACSSGTLHTMQRKQCHKARCLTRHVGFPDSPRQGRMVGSDRLRLLPSSCSRVRRPRSEQAPWS